MKQTVQKEQSKSKGFVLVASSHVNFYKMAVNCGESILDYYPDAKITLFTEERFVDHRADIFDNVIFCDNHYRAKLWGMSQTPYDLTFYMDVDTEVRHKDIAKVFDELGDHDMMFTPLLEENEYCFRSRHFPAGSFQLNGGVCLYNSSNPHVIDFIKEWDRRYRSQRASSGHVYLSTSEKPWWPKNENGDDDYINYPKELQTWDQFTLWWLTNKEEQWSNIDIGIFDDWARWNWYTKYVKDHAKGEIVIIHHSNPQFDKWTDNI